MDLRAPWKAPENCIGSRRYRYLNATSYLTLPRMLGQLRTTTCFRNQHTAGSETGVLINVRMSISWNQAVSKGDLQNATKIPAWAQLVGQTAITS